MGLETSEYSSFFLKSGVLSIFRFVVAKTDSLFSGLTGGVDEVKGGSLAEFDGADMEGL